MNRKLRVALPTTTTALLVALVTPAAFADTVVQVPLPNLLDARSVTTLTGGQIVVFTLPTDGGNLQNAFATAAIAKLKGTPVTNTLPDDGHFPANDRHPEVVLHFSNDADAASPQTHLIPPSTSFEFAVPEATYSKFFLFFNGAAGGATIKITLAYSDGMEMKDATIPDYYADVSPSDPVIFNLATNLAKWDKATAIKEANHHNITGVTLEPMSGKTLTKVHVDRGVEGNLVFWGATGIATSAVATAGAGGGGGAGGASGSAGAASGGSAAAAGAGAAAGGAQAAGAAGASSGLGGASPGGSAGAAGLAATSGGSVAATQVTDTNDSGCGCRLASAGSQVPAQSHAVWLALVGLAGVRLGRRRR